MRYLTLWFWPSVNYVPNISFVAALYGFPLLDDVLLDGMELLRQDVMNKVVVHV